MSQEREEIYWKAAHILLIDFVDILEDFVCKIYPGGVLSAIQAKRDAFFKLLTEDEKNLVDELLDFSQHKYFKNYDKIIQDTILDGDVLDSLISQCVMTKEEREEVESHRKQSDRNKAVLDVLFERFENAYLILIEALKDSEENSAFIESLDYEDDEKASKTQRASHIDEHTVQLQKNYKYIVQNLFPVPEICDQLIEEGILTCDDVAEIVDPVPSKQNRKLLGKIRDKKAYDKFLATLKKDKVNAEIAYKVETTVITAKDLQQQRDVTRSERVGHRLGIDVMILLVSLIADVTIPSLEPDVNNTSLEADLCRLQIALIQIIQYDKIEDGQLQDIIDKFENIATRLSGSQCKPKVLSDTCGAGSQSKQKVLSDTCGAGSQSKQQVLSDTCGAGSQSEQKILSDTCGTGSQSKPKVLSDTCGAGSQSKQKVLSDTCGAGSKLLKETIRHIKKKAERNDVPENIRDKFRNMVDSWKLKDNATFKETRASKHVLQCVLKNSCVTVTASSGVGKTSIIRHTALFLQNKGYYIIPIETSRDIKEYYTPGRRTIFVIDDLCGNYTANQHIIDDWRQIKDTIKSIFDDKYCKILVACRLHVYQDIGFNILSFFKSCQCNLMSSDLCLSPLEKNDIALSYIAKDVLEQNDISQEMECFPFLCSAYNPNLHGDIQSFFRNPFKIYKDELDHFFHINEKGGHKIAALALCIIYNNKIPKTIFTCQDKQVKTMIKDVCESSKLNRGTSVKVIQDALESLVHPDICQHY